MHNFNKINISVILIEFVNYSLISIRFITTFTIRLENDFKNYTQKF